jgi:hypothetical protein
MQKKSLVSDPQSSTWWTFLVKYGEIAEPNQPINPTVVAAAKRKKRTGLELEMDENDEPIVPDPSTVKGSDRETFIRHFVTHYYSELQKLSLSANNNLHSVDRTGVWK